MFKHEMGGGTGLELWKGRIEAGDRRIRCCAVWGTPVQDLNCELYDQRGVRDIVAASSDFGAVATSQAAEPDRTSRERSTAP